ncbi:hypothetical protein [Thalassolituus sp.]|uniref:hypothetical protein n=1 Tax=Thalassolituus sp. TaxID=2030822 RepID=UPI0035112EC0
MSDDKKVETKNERVVDIIADKLVVDISEVVETASIPPEEALGNDASTNQSTDVNAETQEKADTVGCGTRKATRGTSVRPELL